MTGTAYDRLAKQAQRLAADLRQAQRRIAELEAERQRVRALADEWTQMFFGQGWGRAVLAELEPEREPPDQDVDVDNLADRILRRLTPR